MLGGCLKSTFDELMIISLNYQNKSFDFSRNITKTDTVKNQFVRVLWNYAGAGKIYIVSQSGFSRYVFVSDYLTDLKLHRIK